MAQHPDVLIVGGGVIGLTAAYYLAHQGASVHIFDKAEPGKEASWAGAGILPPGNTAKAPAGYGSLRAESAELFPKLSAELRERTGIDNGYRRCGGIEFLQSEQEAEEWKSEEIPFERLSESGLRALEPAAAMSFGRIAYHVPGTAQIRNPRHLQALLAACTANGVHLHPGCPVFRFERQNGQIRGVHTALGHRFAGRFLLASGAWTDPLLADLGIQLGIRPVRGQIVLLNTATPIRKVIEQEKRYLVPRGDGRVLVGSTEEDVGFDSRTTAAAVAELLAFAVERVPALAAAAVERTWAGLRPMSPDRLPCLGAVPGFDNLFIAAGHGRSGLQLSAATGLVMAQVLLDRPPLVPLEAFRVDRLDS